VIRLLLLEDDHLGSSDLAGRLAHEAGITVVAAADIESDIGRLATEMAPDVAVLNTDYMISQILPIVSDLMIARPGCAVIMLCDPTKPGMLPPRRRARQLSYLTKDTPVPALAATVRQVADGEPVTDPQLLLAASHAGRAVSTREWEVLGLVAQGDTVADISHRLYLSLGTVRNYISSIIAKTGARNRIDAIRIARKGGWLH
jgi:two-component system response regulator DesR